MFVVQPRWHQSGTAGEAPSAELVYVGVGTNSRTEAELGFADQTPFLVGSLPRRDMAIVQIGPLLWEATINYGSPGRPERREIGQGSRSFEVGFKTERIQHARATRTYWEGAPALPPPDFGTAINPTKDGIAGVDVQSPVFTWTETQIISLAQFNSDTYFHNLWTVANAPVNNAPFRNFQAGEVLFLGAAGSERDAESAEMTFRFSGSPNVQNLDLENIEEIRKDGWEYLAPFVEDEVDEDAKVITKRLRAVYVHRVYDTSDFSLLGL